MSLLGVATINGTTATFRRVILGDVDVEAGTQATSNTDQTVHLINLSTEVGEASDIDTNERRYRLIASEITGAAPDTEDQIVIGSATYEIVTAKAVEKRAVVAFYDLVLRRIA